ncbi:MAG TPA: twin transmembrane helix small protein [Stellaceae bacterium]|nr:twin transmembrane helix small protein [Stellaceae bacterium]
MRLVLTVLLVLALCGVLVVLGLGVVTLMKGGNPRRSNKLMQSRVILQAIALLLLAMLMLLGGR